jgi:hypothetical protein
VAEGGERLKEGEVGDGGVGEMEFAEVGDGLGLALDEDAAALFEDPDGHGAVICGEAGGQKS